MIAAGMETFPDRDVLAAAAAEALAGALTRPGRRSLVVTGGTSPGAVYDRLAQLDLDWPKLSKQQRQEIERARRLLERERRR